MTRRTVTQKEVNKIFNIALLLTASMNQAESAVLEAIDGSQLYDIDSEALLQSVMAKAIAAFRSAPRPTFEELREASSILPYELQNVLRLDAGHRQCFVLRTLVGLSREACFRLLQVPIREIDQQTTAAMLQLATMQVHPPMVSEQARAQSV